MHVKINHTLINIIIYFKIYT